MAARNLLAARSPVGYRGQLVADFVSKTAKMTQQSIQVKTDYFYIQTKIFNTLKYFLPLIPTFTCLEFHVPILYNTHKTTFVVLEVLS